MNWLDALLLGIVQGLAEYLPISSSGHLEIFRQILGVNLPSDKTMQFDIVLHAATVCSTLVVLWPMFYKLCKSFFTFRRDEDFFYVCKILVSCIPIAIIGFLFKDFIENFFGTGLFLIGICLCITALLLAFAHFSDRMIPANRGRNISWLDAFVIGCAQAIAVLPGLSRSGTTIATGIILGDRRDKMAQFSFLMVIIPILGEALLDLKNIISPESAAEAMPVSGTSLLIGFFAAFVVGCCACKWMIELVKKGKLIWFALYCVAMGILCIIW